MGKTGLGKRNTFKPYTLQMLQSIRAILLFTAQAKIFFPDLQNEHFGRTENNLYNEYDILNTDLLIIDDLGTEFKNSYSIACLYNIVNTRILKKKPTIISTNYDFNQLDDVYDMRITSRIAGEYSTLVLEGNDIGYIK